MQFPPKHTEEELMLQSKYAKLRKKKKQLAAHQNPVKNVEAEKASVMVTGSIRFVLKRMARPGGEPFLVFVDFLFLMQCLRTLGYCVPQQANGELDNSSNSSPQSCLPRKKQPSPDFLFLV